jgi:nuclear receptor-binding protein
MDTEDGVEVVWNEVRYSSRKAVAASKEVLVKILKRLTEMQHPNIVNFMSFWHDKVSNQDRLVFITEHMTSGSLLHFLLKAKRPAAGKTSVSDKMWRRWCRQILSALSYLHKNDIVHGNLSLASIFIQHNGAVKIGSVSPDAIHEHVKTKQLEHKARLHYTAPEYAGNAPIGTSADIYSFGVCALEMLNLELLAEGRGVVRREDIDNTLSKLRPERRQQFIAECLYEEPAKRPLASLFIKHPVLQEVFELKVLSALALRRLRIPRAELEAHIDSKSYSHRQKEEVLANAGGAEWKVENVPPMDWEKYLEEIELDVMEEPHKVSKFHSTQKEEDSTMMNTPRSRGCTSERNSMQYENETRVIEEIAGTVRKSSDKTELCLQLTFTDRMQRGLKTEFKEGDSGDALAMDLVFNGLISETDRERVSVYINQKIGHPVS